MNKRSIFSLLYVLDGDVQDLRQGRWMQVGRQVSVGARGGGDEQRFVDSNSTFDHIFVLFESYNFNQT